MKVLYSGLAANINITNTQEHQHKINVGLGHGKTGRLSCQGVPKLCKVLWWPLRLYNQ